MPTNKKILIVDDEEPVRKFMSRILEHGGYRCSEAAGADEARTRMREQEYALVLCDVKMPGVSGLDLLRYICGEHPQTATLMVTSADSPEDAHAAFEVGAHGYLVKPFGANELLISAANSLHRRALEIENRAHRERLEHVVLQRTAAFEQAMAELKRAKQEKENILASISSVLIGVDENGLVTAWNAPAEQTFGIVAQDVIGRPFVSCGIRWHDRGMAERLLEYRTQNGPARLDDLRFTDLQGTPRFLGVTVNPFRTGENGGCGLLLHAKDVTERKSLETQLRQAQKLEAVGQLAAGIAHEINTPIQYIGDNTRFLRDAFGDLQGVIDAGNRLLNAARESAVTQELIAQFEAAAQQADLEYLAQEIPKAIQQSSDGVDRVSRIVRAMKEFSHPGCDEKTALDINKAIQSTLIVARNEWKYVAETVTNLDPELPLVSCLPGEINQVLLNLIVNAAHAIADATGSEPGRKGTITITTQCIGDGVEIRIGDTGRGIPEAIRDRIFDPFFTTKPVGKGTGQGLTIAHAVVVKKHGGKITFQSELGKGTTFVIWLPLQEPAGPGV